jgi:hypothetical protein
MKPCPKQGILIVISICLCFLWDIHLSGDHTPIEKYQFTELFCVGVEEAAGLKDQPYQFTTIINIDCDKKGDIYVLDYRDKCVKKFSQDGKFIEQFFQQGQGPKEIANPFSMSINKYTDHIFILQDYGLSIKEFDLRGEYVKRYVLSKQFFGDFHFVSKDEFIYRNAVPYKDKFNNFMRLNVSQNKIVQEFAYMEMDSHLNYMQRFTIDSNSILWASRGDEMKLFGYDINTGKKVHEIQIPGSFKKNILLQSAGDGDSQITNPILYNFAQPFVINDQLFAMVIIQQYEKKNGEIDKFPITSERIIYQVNGSHFEKLGIVNNGEDIYVGTVYKNRLILFSNEPYGHFRVFEFKKPSGK